MVNVEARSLDAKVVTRRCVLAKLKELTIEKYREIISQSAGGLLVLLPNNLAALSKEENEVRITHVCCITTSQNSVLKIHRMFTLFRNFSGGAIVMLYFDSREQNLA